eukprot:GEZU01018662.1.p1 GENE.GEZU01018662.1~~GEZU01018662.1.p1  ORF type:complete len:311 (-),score=93.79 GEZU01018662.1:47-979(-)
MDTSSNISDSDMISTASVSSNSTDLKDAIEEIDLTGDGGVKKKILREGTGESPPQGSTVSVHYVGRLLDGTIFDSSRARNKFFDFTLGVGQVIKGWDVGIASMKEGELALLTCAADYAYGSYGSPPTIPPNATLEFEVELFSFEPADEKKEGEMTAEEKIQAALKKKDEGNDLFKEGRYERARVKYEKAISYLTSKRGMREDEKKKASEVELPCYLNLAACTLKTKEYLDAIQYSTKALAIDEKNLKGLFRRAQAYSGRGDFDKAMEDLNRALVLYPDNKEIRNEVATVNKKLAAQKQKEKKMYAQMFSQ